MRTSKYRKKLNISDKQKKIVLGGVGACCLAGVLFFFLYFKVENVEIMGSGHYTEKEIKAMVLRGPMAELCSCPHPLYHRRHRGYSLCGRL